MLLVNVPWLFLFLYQSTEIVMGFQSVAAIRLCSLAIMDVLGIQPSMAERVRLQSHV